MADYQMVEILSKEPNWRLKTIKATLGSLWKDRYYILK